MTLKGINFYIFRSLKSIQCRKFEIVTISLNLEIDQTNTGRDLSRLNFIIMIQETFISREISFKSIVPIPCSFNAVSKLMELKIEIENREIRFYYY